MPRELAPAEESVTLYFREGSSDKVYTASLVKRSLSWDVDFAYGRRGSTMNTGSKISGVEYEKAKKIYDKLVAEKTGKGYTPGESGVAYQHTSSEERDSGVRVMLLNEVEESELERLLTDDAWGAQEKMDGRRQVVKGTVADIVAINRKGLMVAPADSVASAASTLKRDSFTIDGEAVGDVLYAFDMLQDGPVDCRSEGFFKRYIRLMKALTGVTGAIKLVKLHEGTAAKRALLQQLKQRQAEGIVFKLLTAPYTAGRPNAGGSALKFKFCATASFIVSKVNAKRSVELKLVDNTVVGNVTIPANKEIPRAGDIVEVRYLYCFRGGSLFQPVYLGERDDISVRECTVAQLKFKADGAEEEG